MPRPPRPQIAAGIYHVATRGVRKQPIYDDQLDRQAFLGLIGEVVERYGWRCYAYCLMGNHYHLLAETPQPTISDGMCRLNGLYARRFNARHGFDGHLFEKRFHAELVERDEHLLEVARYIVLNPVRAGICASPADWPWSSFRAVAGYERPLRFLSTRWTLQLFGRRREVAQEAFRGFVLSALTT
jgi:REP element-mobilizing transposase RayT